MHIHMVKVISLSEEAYGTLKSAKGKDDSFSDVVLRLTARRRPPLSELAGKWKDRKELDKIEKMIYNNRRKAKLRAVRFD